ncbi:hypothetical protein [Moorena sp. SIO3I6]|nr:hypothetical protein [Moorena sp. SIO3I6]
MGQTALIEMDPENGSDRISAEAEAVGHALRSRSVGFAETLHRV